MSIPQRKTEIYQRNSRHLTLSTCRPFPSPWSSVPQGRGLLGTCTRAWPSSLPELCHFWLPLGLGLLDGETRQENHEGNTQQTRHINKTGIKRWIVRELIADHLVHGGWCSPGRPYLCSSWWAGSGSGQSPLVLPAGWWVCCWWHSAPPAQSQRATCRWIWKKVATGVNWRDGVAWRRRRRKEKELKDMERKEGLKERILGYEEQQEVRNGELTKGVAR